MFWKRKKLGRIFICYRRSDAMGVAGRLSDSLENYFGDNRVFRDIEDIDGGADFGNVISKNLESADAMIVLIGNKWLAATTADGQKRLEKSDDWVTQEISGAIEKGIPLFPVLIEDAAMPREEELPDKLKPMVRYNALNVSDARWEFDVRRLAKIISLDLPSTNELKLNVVRILVSFGLCISLCFSTAVLTLNQLRKVCHSGVTDEKLCNLTEYWVNLIDLPNPNLLKLWQAGVPYVIIIASSLTLFTVINLVAKERRRYIYASIGVGAIGTFLFFAFQIAQGRNEEPIIGFFGSVLIVSLMLVLMNLSGFKAK